MERNHKPGVVVVPHRAKWRQRLAAAVIYGLIRGVAATIRFRMDDRSGIFAGAPKEKLIFSIWHNRLALSLIMYRRYVSRLAPERRMAALVSASRDGGLLARILEHFGVEPVRGSSSRRGPRALRELLTWSERGYDLAITPDGPRGPCYEVQDGVMSAAQLTGLPIVPVSYHLNWKVRLPSWDRFHVPLPFARCDITLGELLRVSRQATAADREAPQPWLLGIVPQLNFLGKHVLNNNQVVGQFGTSSSVPKRAGFNRDGTQDVIFPDTGTKDFGSTTSTFIFTEPKDVVDFTAGLSLMFRCGWQWNSGISIPVSRGNVRPFEVLTTINYYF